jgi:dienelactone hydrolase
MEPVRKESWFAYFPEDYRWSAAVLILLSTAPWGSSDIGEVDRVGKRLRTNIGNDQAWFEEWTRMGEELEARAGEASSKNRFVTACRSFLRASMYFQMGERFRQPKDQKALDVFRRGVDCFKEGARYLDSPSVEHVEVPYVGGKSLPAMFVKSPGNQKGPIPVVLFFDGLDVTKEICYFMGGVPDLARRGIGCLLVDGPGNGESIRFRGLYLRHDQETPAKAAVDYLETRRDVDLNRIGVMALSLGGYYAPRSAAFEKRLKACLAWGAQWDYQAVWKRRVEVAYRTALSVPPDHIMWVLNASSIEDALKRLEKFKLAGVAEKISCPFLLVHGADDAQIPLEDARRCFDAVGSKDKTLKIFTTENGGSQHCNIDYLGLALPYMHDWLAEKLKA